MALSLSCCYIHPLHPLPPPKCETEGVFPRSTHHHPHFCPLSRFKREMEGAFPLSTHHQYPSLAPNARRRGFLPTNPFSPLKRETRVFPLSTHHLYPLPRSTLISMRLPARFGAGRSDLHLCFPPPLCFPCFNARRGRLLPSHLVHQGFLALRHLVLFK